MKVIKLKSRKIIEDPVSQPLVEEFPYPIDRAFKCLVNQHLSDILHGRPEAILNFGGLLGKLDVMI